MEYYIINEKEAPIIYLALKKYENNVEKIVESDLPFKPSFKLKVSGTAEELEPIKRICKTFKITLNPVVEETTEPAEDAEPTEE